MSKKTFGREFAEEAFCKAMTSAAPIAAGIILSPMGMAAVVAAAAIANLGSGGRSAPEASGSKETGSST